MSCSKCKTSIAISNKNINIKKLNNIRINGKCICCLKNFNRLEVHHIDGDRENNKETNLIGLCKKCHNKVHNPKLIYQNKIGWERKILNDLFKSCTKSKRAIKRFK